MRSFVILLALSTVAFSDLTPICQNGYSLVNNRCLRLYTNPVVHKDAVQTCSSDFGTLVTIKNAIDNRALATFVGTSIKHLWIGLYCFQSDTSDCLWDDANGSASDYNNFATNFPYTDVGNCVYYSVSGTLAGQWVSDDCDDETRQFVCETPSTFDDSCDQNYNGHCYFSSFYWDSWDFDQLSFDDAESACEDVCGHLVSIHSPGEIRFLQRLMHQSGPSLDEVYIGALTVSGKYHTWTDGSEWNFDNVDTTSQTSGSCLMMSKRNNGDFTQDAWYPSDCQVRRNYVCKRPAGIQCRDYPIPPGSTTTECSTNTPDPNIPQDCNRFIMAPGTFTSPGYPGHYTNNLNCEFSLATLGSYKIRLSFNTFDTEAGSDKVWVYDGDSADAPLLNRLSGQPATPIYFESSGNRMFVVFTTDASMVGPGFSANFLSVI